MLDDAELEVAVAVQTRFADILLEKVKKNAPKINKNKGEKQLETCIQPWTGFLLPVG